MFDDQWSCTYSYAFRYSRFLDPCKTATVFPSFRCHVTMLVEPTFQDLKPSAFIRIFYIFLVWRLRTVHPTWKNSAAVPRTHKALESASRSPGLGTWGCLVKSLRLYHACARYGRKHKFYTWMMDVYILVDHINVTWCEYMVQVNIHNSCLNTRISLVLQLYVLQMKVARAIFCCHKSVCLKPGAVITGTKTSSVDFTQHKTT